MRIFDKTEYQLQLEVIKEAKSRKSFWVAIISAISTPSIAGIWLFAVSVVPMIWGFPLWILGPVITGYLLFWWMLKYATDLKKQLKPEISLAFTGDKGSCIVKTREEIPLAQFVRDERTGFYRPDTKNEETIYIRVKTDSLNRRCPKKCAAYLYGVEKTVESGATTKGALHDGLQLPWALIGIKEIPLATGIPRHFDVCKTRQGSNKIELIGAVPFSLDGFFTEEKATYVFHVAVVADGKTESLKFNVEWKGRWDDFNAYPINNT